jgi:hypothetical protein
MMIPMTQIFVHVRVRFVGSASWDKIFWQMRSSADPAKQVGDDKKDCKSLANRCGMQFRISSFEHLWNKSGASGVLYLHGVPRRDTEFYGVIMISFTRFFRFMLKMFRAASDLQTIS